MDIKEEGLLCGNISKHWYYRAKTKATLKLIAKCRKSVLWDVGAGSGFFSRQILSATDCREAICVDTGYETEHEEHIGHKILRFSRTLPTTPADLVLLMDVMEHVEDDFGLLNQYVSSTSVGTSFLITVPAFMRLWSGHDVFLGHYRRYGLASIVAVAKRAGLVIDRHCYFYGLVFPLAAAQRLASRWRFGTNEAPKSQMRPYPAPVNFALRAICALIVSLGVV